MTNDEINPRTQDPDRPLFEAEEPRFGLEYLSPAGQAAFNDWLFVVAADPLAAGYFLNRCLHDPSRPEPRDWAPKDSFEVLLTIGTTRIWGGRYDVQIAANKLLHPKGFDDDTVVSITSSEYASYCLRRLNRVIDERSIRISRLLTYVGRVGCYQRGREAIEEHGTK